MIDKKKVCYSVWHLCIYLYNSTCRWYTNARVYSTSDTRHAIACRATMLYMTISWCATCIPLCWVKLKRSGFQQISWARGHVSQYRVCRDDVRCVYAWLCSSIDTHRIAMQQRGTQYHGLMLGNVQNPLPSERRIGNVCKDLCKSHTISHLNTDNIVPCCRLCVHLIDQIEPIKPINCGHYVMSKIILRAHIKTRNHYN